MELTDKELQLIEFALLDSSTTQGGFTDAEFARISRRMNRLMDKVSRELERRKKAEASDE